MRRRRRQVTLFFVGGFWLLIGGTFAGVWQLSALAFTGVICLGSLGSTLWDVTEEKRYHARLRRRFLRERKGQMLPGAKPRQRGDGPVE